MTHYLVTKNKTKLQLKPFGQGKQIGCPGVSAVFSSYSMSRYTVSAEDVLYFIIVYFSIRAAVACISIIISKANSPLSMCCFRRVFMNIKHYCTSDYSLSPAPDTYIQLLELQNLQ